METENQKLRERVEELSRETMLLAHTVTDLTAKLKLATAAAPQPVNAAQAVPELTTKLINDMEWPEGYVTDPNGVIVPPQGRVNDYNFGYNQGYGDGLLAIKDSVAAIVARTVPDGYVVVPRVPTLDMYNAACKAFCAWEVMCADEARDGQDFTQPNFTHSDAYVAMLAAAPGAQPTDTTKEM